uniref:N-acetyltransferase domain-containing protein n=1 Tax=Parascaris equorum TaxID=6256 RepID=A0A914RN61_PAREQ
MVNIQQLEPFKEVLRRQVPREVGKPIPMKVYEIKHPKNSGDPWMGAYSKHGFWYKFYRGNSDDFDKCIFDVIFDRRSSNCDDDFFKGDVLGSVAFACYDDVAVIGVYFVIEDYRHSGIGTKLFSEALKRIGSKNIIFHSRKRLIYFRIFT